MLYLKFGRDFGLGLSKEANDLAAGFRLPPDFG